MDLPSSVTTPPSMDGMPSRGHDRPTRRKFFPVVAAATCGLVTAAWNRHAFDLEKKSIAGVVKMGGISVRMAPPSGWILLPCALLNIAASLLASDRALLTQSFITQLTGASISLVLLARPLLHGAPLASYGLIPTVLTFISGVREIFGAANAEARFRERQFAFLRMIEDDRDKIEEAQRLAPVAAEAANMPKPADFKGAPAR